MGGRGGSGAHAEDREEEEEEEEEDAQAPAHFTRATAKLLDLLDALNQGELRTHSVGWMWSFKVMSTRLEVECKSVKCCHTDFTSDRSLCFLSLSLSLSLSLCLFCRIGGSLFLLM